MKLQLAEEDLNPTFVDDPTSTISFEKLNADAQRAVLAVGQGTFYRSQGTRWETYNVIYAPKVSR